MTTFYLVSTELREPYAPRKCRVISRLRSELRDDLALVEVDPPLLSTIYDTGEDIHRLVLGARHQGASIFPVAEWPLAVYICRLSEADGHVSDAIASEKLSILDWGEIRQTS